MAGIDPNIALSVRPLQLESPINQMAAMAQLQSAQQQQQMNALKLEEARRADMERNALLQTISGEGFDLNNPAHVQNLLRKAPTLGMPYVKEARMAAAEKARADQEAVKAEHEKFKMRREQLDFTNAALQNSTNPTLARAHIQQAIDLKYVSPEAGTQMLASVPEDPTEFEAWRANLLSHSMTAKDQLERDEKQLEKRTKQENADYADYVYATKVANPDAKVLSKADFLAQRKAAPAALPTAEVSAAPTNAAATTTTTTPAAVTVAADGTQQLPGVAVTADDSLDPLAAELYRIGDPRYKEIADKLQAAHVERKKRGELTGEFQNVVLARKKIQELQKNPTPENLAIIADLEKQIKAAQEGKATKVNVGVKLPPQEQEFEKELGKGQAKDVIENRAKALDARDMLDTVKIGRGILKSGAITGAGADFFVGLNQALKTAGVDFGYADASANSQAYTANMAQNVGKLIKLFGAGTGLSNADRDYAEKMAGGKITLDKAALEKILDIQDRAARNVIRRHNENVKGIRTNIPLEVNLDSENAAPKAPAVGTVQNGYKFKGGNPADQKNWEKVK